jgi:hypothetical protein
VQLPLVLTLLQLAWLNPAAAVWMCYLLLLYIWERSVLPHSPMLAPATCTCCILKAAYRVSCRSHRFAASSLRHKCYI